MVSNQMNIDVPKFDKVEANIEGLRTRFPELPLQGVLLSRLLLYLGRGMSTLLDLEIRPHGLAEVEFRVLTTLYSQPDGVASPSELCARTSQSPANMSRISDALLERGHLTRIPSVRDRRKLVLRITEQGESLVRELLPQLYGPLRDMFKDFSDAEQLFLIDQLKRVGSRMDTALTHRVRERSA